MEKQLRLAVVIVGLLIPIALIAKTKPQSTDQYVGLYIEKLPPRPKAEVVFISVPQVSNRIKEDSLYADIINHATDPVLDHNLSRNIQAHESVHRVNSDIRNAQGPGFNGFYVLNSKGVVLREPKILKSSVIDYLPENLRSDRFNTYLVGAHEWQLQPLYLVDEFSAYVADAMVSIEDVQNGRGPTYWHDGVSGCLDFSIFTIALAMAVYDQDRAYWDETPQFRIFLQWLLERAYKTYKAGYKMKQFVWADQEKLHSQLLNSPEGEPMREFIKKHFGGVWLD